MAIFSSRHAPVAMAGGMRPRSCTARRLPLIAALLSTLVLLVAACGASSSNGPGASSTPTTGPRAATVWVYFTNHPGSDNTPTVVYAVARATTYTTTQDQATSALQELLKGPMQAERAYPAPPENRRRAAVGGATSPRERRGVAGTPRADGRAIEQSHALLKRMLAHLSHVAPAKPERHDGAAA